MPLSAAAIEANIDTLLGRMTLDEKIGQMIQVPNVGEKHLELLRAGQIGSSLFAGSAYAGNEKQRALATDQMNRMQKIAVEETRLGIPLLYARDVIHGYRSVAPIPLGQAASWSPELIRDAAAVAAREASAVGIRWTFTPMLDIARDPRWGRIAEGFGEDPYLCGKLARAAVEGYQGDLSRPDQIVACAKHYVGYGAAEGGRDYNTADFSEHTLRNVYLPSFHAAAQAGVGTFMSSFNEIGGVPVTGSRYLLTQILKEEWGWDGFIVSDWNAVTELMNHGVAADEKDCAELAANAGLDMEMVSRAYLNHLSALVREGKVKEQTIDAAVRRILRIKYRLGLFEQPYTDPERANGVLVCPAHLQSARI